MSQLRPKIDRATRALTHAATRAWSVMETVWYFIRFPYGGDSWR